MSDIKLPIDVAKDDRLAAEDLRRQFQERDAAKPNAVLPDRDLLNSIATFPERLAKIALSAGLDSDATKTAIEEYKALFTNSKARTEYDDPVWSALIETLQHRIEDACSALRIPLKSGVVIGTDLISSTNARQYKVPLTDASILSVGAHLFYLCSVISKATARSLICTPTGESQIVCYDPEKVIRNIKSDKSLTKYWITILISFAYSDGPHLVPFELHGPHLAPLRFQFLEAMELYVLAHELGHHVSSIARVERLPVNLGANESHNEELRADIIACMIVNYLGGKPNSVNLYAGSGAAAIFLLLVFEMIEKTRQLLGGGNDHLPASTSHPTTAERLSAIAIAVDSMTHPSERPALADMRNCFIEIAERLWTHLHCELNSVIKP